MDNAQKIIELNSLYQSGAINKEEFDKIKSELLSNADANKSLTTGQRILLKSFIDLKGITYQPPNVSFIDISNITDKEINLLKNFISLKQKYAPAEMTQDEIQIANKMFSNLEIAQINSQREGFNHAFEAIFGTILIAASIFVLTISPCMAVLGAGTGTIASAFMAYNLLNKADSTKLDKIFGQIITLGVIIAVVIFMNSKK